jgi:hypothetical protein
MRQGQARSKGADVPGFRLVGWWPMCGGLSEVAARLKAEARRQHFFELEGAGGLGSHESFCAGKKY